MLELLYESVKLVNLPYTVLFGFTLLYWVLYLVGILGSDVLDFFNLDLDADLDADVQPSGIGGLLVSAMRFVHAGDVPVTVVVTTLSMMMWAFSVMTNSFLGNASLLIALALALPLFVAAVIVTRQVLKPFVPLLKKAFDESGDVIELIGKYCTVVSLEVSPKHGQAEVGLKGSPLLINVRSREGESLRKGEEAVVFGKDDEGVYLIAPLDTFAE